MKNEGKVGKIIQFKKYEYSETIETIQKQLKQIRAGIQVYKYIIFSNAVFNCF
jgi:hypothetical protein